MMQYTEDDYLQLSGLQHFSFCRRQWALIHIENQWQDNLRTVEGELLHERAHKEGFSEKRRDLITSRGLRVFSPTLGVAGNCDIVEFRLSENGVRLNGQDGRWNPVPIEYKRGISKINDADRLQLCGQAICLEEMLACDIPHGYLFYGETRRREKVEFTEELRRSVIAMLTEMHELYRRGYTPRVKPGKHCNACSLKEICLPSLLRKTDTEKYINTALAEEPI